MTRISSQPKHASHRVWGNLGQYEIRLRKLRVRNLKIVPFTKNFKVSSNFLVFTPAP